MKIAICLSGMIRTGVEAAPLIKSYIGNLYTHVDLFMHTWDITSKKPWHHESIAHKHYKEPEVKYISSAGLIEKLRIEYDNKFKDILIEDMSVWESGFSNYRAFSPQWYSWFKSIEIKSLYENANNFKYDIVVRMRPDCIYPENHKLLDEIILFLENPELFYASNFSTIRVDDVFFLSKSEIMDEASKFIIRTQKREWETNIVGEYFKSVNITPSRTLHNQYTILRDEALTKNYRNYAVCYNVDREYYSPYTTINDRLKED